MKLTISQMHELFDIVQDKFNEDYFVDDEKDVFLNHAQQLVVNEIIFGEYYPNGVNLPVAIEINSINSELLSEIIVGDLPVSCNADGNLEKVAINSAIQSEYGSDTSYAIILSIFSGGNATSINPNVAIGYIPHNNISAFRNNDFKKPSSSKPYYRHAGNTLIIEPSAPNEELLVSLIRYPKKVSKLSGTDCELSYMIHEKVVAVALEYAGVATINEALIAINKSY